jgi:hypothetical protein
LRLSNSERYFVKRKITAPPLNEKEAKAVEDSRFAGAILALLTISFKQPRFFQSPKISAKID